MMTKKLTDEQRIRKNKPIFDKIEEYLDKTGG
jgi:hypothetical protein